jgi:alkylhydroperoxidase family enzyme
MIPLLSVDEANKRGTEAGVPEQLRTLNVFRAMLHNPTAAGAAANLLTTLLFRNKLDARLRELVILRTGWRCASEYEFCQHVQVAKRLKMTEEEILGVRDPDSCKAYSELDRGVIAMTDELFEGSSVSERTWSVLARSLSAEHLVELLLAVGNWRMLAIFLNSAKVPLDPRVPSWPEGRKPR